MQAWVSAAACEENTSTKGCKTGIKSVSALQCERVHVRGTVMQGNVRSAMLGFQQPLSFYSVCLVEEESLRSCLSVVSMSKLAELWAACHSAISRFTQTQKWSDVHQPWADLGELRLGRAVFASARWARGCDAHICALAFVSSEGFHASRSKRGCVVT